MIIKWFNKKLYYILEERPLPQPDPYGPDMWGDLESRSKFGTHKQMVQKFTKVGPPRPLKKYTPEEAADRLASIEKKEPISTDALMVYNKQTVRNMGINPRTLADWLDTSPGSNPCISNCDILHTPPCSSFGDGVTKVRYETPCWQRNRDCGVTGCTNSNCDSCTTSFYGNIGV